LIPDLRDIQQYKCPGPTQYLLDAVVGGNVFVPHELFWRDLVCGLISGGQGRAVRNSHRLGLATIMSFAEL
jgi:hypothetical protein